MCVFTPVGDFLVRFPDPLGQSGNQTRDFLAVPVNYHLDQVLVPDQITSEVAPAWVQTEMQKAADNLCYFFQGGANFFALHANRNSEHCAAMIVPLPLCGHSTVLAEERW